MISAGIRYMFFATFFFALMNVLVKTLDLPAVEIAFFRALGSLSLAYGILKVKGITLPGKNIKGLILRGFFGSTSLVFYFITLQNMPLASAVTIQFLSPIFTTVLGIFLVKESVKPLQWFFFAMAFSGVILIQGFDSRVSIEYLLLGIGSAIFSALAYNMIRMLKNTEHPLVIVFYFPLVTLPITGFFTLFQFEMPHGWDWAIMGLIGILAQLGQYFMTRAYQVDELSKISSMKYLGILYALFFGTVFFEEHFTFQVYVGIGVVLVGVILNIWYKHVVQKRKALDDIQD